MCGLLICIGLLILIGINRARKAVESVEMDDNPENGGAYLVEEDILENVGNFGECDEQAELLKAYAALGAKGELSLEEEVEYMRLSELLARNYICVGHPAVD